MKYFVLAVLLSCSACSWGNPALVLVDRDDSKFLPAEATVVRDLGPRLFVAAELSGLTAAGIPFQIIDSEYSPNQYLLVRGPSQAAARGLPVLWQDEAGALLRLSNAPGEATYWRSGGEELLEQSPPTVRESRPPAHLDDPVLDQWLTELAADVNADSLFGYVSTLASYNRYTRWTSNDNAAAWIRDKLLSYGLDSVYYHAFTASGTGWSR